MSELIEALKLGKSIAKNLALGNSAVVSLYQRRRGQQGYSADKDQVDYPLGVFRKHATALAPLRKNGLQDTAVLEIGPGGNVGVSLLMLLAGAKSATCLDVVALHATDTTTVTEQMRQKFHPHFQGMSLEDLAIIGILLVARKP